MKLSSRMIIIGLVSMLLLTSCATKEENADSKPTATIEATATATPITETTGTPDVTPTDGNEVTTSPTEDTTSQVTTPPVEETIVPIETDSPVTTAPETQAPADDKVYADPEEYPDDWGKKRGPIIVKGNIFFWKKSRVMHTTPENFDATEKWHILFSDEKNDQFVFFVERDGGEYVEFYSMVQGTIYKLNEGGIIGSWDDGTGPFYWVEEDGTAKSVNVRSHDYSEVYIEAEGVFEYVRSRNAFATRDGKFIKPNSQNILAELKVIS